MGGIILTSSDRAAHLGWGLFWAALCFMGADMSVHCLFGAVCCALVLLWSDLTGFR